MRAAREEAKHASFASFDDEKARKDELRLNAAKKQEELITQEVPPSSYTCIYIYIERERERERYITYIYIYRLGTHAH